MNKPQTMSPLQLERVKREKLELYEAKLKRMEELPHLYGLKHYQWQKEFINSRSKMNILTAANQIGKSSVQIIKSIKWATSPEIWKELWAHKDPRQFWYLYPTTDTATIEFHEKWVPEFMPKGSMKDDPVFGWTAEFERKQIKYIRFNSGVTIYFKTYAQQASALQAGSVDAIFCFTAGHLVLTDKGNVPIEDIGAGDKVLTRAGFKEVKAIRNREAEVSSYHFENGESLRGTCEHPIFTDRGWVPLEQLTALDDAYTVPEWKMLKTLYILKKAYTTVTQIIQTQEQETTSRMKKGIIYMFLFGKRTIKRKFLKIVLFIIETLTHSIMRLRILNVLQDPSIPRSTRLRSGKLLKRTHLTVYSAELHSSHGRLKEPSPDTVPRSAVKKHTEIVYNLTVANTPEYFVNGILVHNCDEELPEHLFDELKFRLAGTQGYYHMVFTATLNQHLWKMAIEPEYRGTELEKFPLAAKWQISTYDCEYYADGSPSNWTPERIAALVATCSSETEVQRRIFGRFVTEEGLMYPNFSAKDNTLKEFTLPGEWLVYTGIDYGSGGGGKNHPASIVFVGVSPEYTEAVVFKCWRGDSEVTTAETILEKYVELRKPFVRQEVATYYDYHCKDMLTISYGMDNVNLLSANKKRDEGQGVLNALFKAKALKVLRTPEGEKLVYELENLLENTDKRRAIDDLIDSLRYALAVCPFDWSKLKQPKGAHFKKKPLTEDEERRKWFLDETAQVADDISQELKLWNDLLD